MKELNEYETAALAWLRENPGATVQDVGEALAIDDKAAGRALEGLYYKKYIGRQQEALTVAVRWHWFPEYMPPKVEA